MHANKSPLDVRDVRMTSGLFFHAWLSAYRECRSWACQGLHPISDDVPNIAPPSLMAVTVDLNLQTRALPHLAERTNLA